jgi:hypothetical protein
VPECKVNSMGTKRGRTVGQCADSGLLGQRRVRQPTGFQRDKRCLSEEGGVAERLVKSGR